MTRGIFLVGSESSLFSAAAAEAAKRVESFALALIPNRFYASERGQGAPAAPKKETGKGAIFLPWNQSSPISARTLVLAAESRLGQINDAVLICSPPALFKDIETLKPEEIDILVNDHIRGWFFLIRELALYFRRSLSGSLSFVAPEAGSRSAGGKGAPADLLGATAVASFRTLAQGIVDSPADGAFLTMGFSVPEPCPDGEFALWLFKTIDEASKKNSGRWHKYSKLSFLR